jgi:hypothetical protein
VSVTHGGACSHKAGSWVHALALALACAGTVMDVPTRESVVRSLIKGEPVWHDGVLFTKG